MKFSCPSAALACALVLGVGAPALAMDADPVTRTVTVAPQATPEATLAELKAAVDHLLNKRDTNVLWTWKFKPGTYTLRDAVRAQRIRNVAIESDPAAPARIVKDARWVYGDTAIAEYLMDFRFCRNMSLRGFEFTGSTVDFPPNGLPVNWQDQGVEFASCDTVKVENNRFNNFGNAALRFMTMPTDPVKGVNSLNTTVVGNRFDNIYQISTTSIDLEHGGSRSYLLANNVFTRLHGAVKFASRTAGASDVKIINNLIEDGSHFGIEVNGYESMEIRGNVLRDIRRAAITIYTNGICSVQPDGTTKCTAGFDWGSNFTIADNVIERAGRGILYSHTPWKGYDNRPANLVIRNNALSDIAYRDPDDRFVIGAIYVHADMGFSGVRVEDNRFLRIADGKLVSSVPASSSGVVVANNNALKAAPVRDLDANLKSELVWQQAASAGSAIAQWPTPSGWREGAFVVPAGARVVVMTDLDGDRRPDALLRDPATNRFSLLRASDPAVQKHLATLDASWQVAAAGDFNGDGFVDLVWRRNNDPITVIWFMGLDTNGEVAIVSRATLGMDATWQVIASADFDGDAKADLLWRQPGTANTQLWLMDGATIKAPRPQLMIDANSYMVAAGDFDGDGKAEILLRNPVTGLLTQVYGAASTQPRQESFAGLEPVSWQIGAVGDYNGDGRCDIGWLSKTDGRVRIWSMNGAVPSQTVLEVAAPAGAWQLVR